MKFRSRLFSLCAGIAAAFLVASPHVAAQTVENGRIAFTSDISGRAEIYTVNLDGSELQELTYESGASPNWSPDGGRLAFVKISDGDPELYLMNADGSNQAKLLNRPETWEFTPVWSPDGAQIAFTSQDPHNPIPKADIYIVNADGSDLRVVTSQLAGSLNHFPSWSSDGSKILFLSNVNIPLQSGVLPDVYDIYVVGIDGNIPQLLYRGGDDIGSVEWSPNGEQIIYHELQPGLNLGFEIMRRDPDALGPYIISNDERADVEPSWSPDGSLIVFSRFEEGRYLLYTMQVDGTNQRRVTDSVAGNERAGDWQPVLPN